MSRFSSKFADRGKKAEQEVQRFLATWSKSPGREANRLTDTRAAGRIIKAAPADFDFYAKGRFGLVEVKETQHEYRLERAKLTQLARLKLRMFCGGDVVVLVHHSTIQQWRAVSVQTLLDSGDKGSWNLSHLPTFDSAALALQHIAAEVFA